MTDKPESAFKLMGDMYIGKIKSDGGFVEKPWLLLVGDSVLERIVAPTHDDVVEAISRIQQYIANTNEQRWLQALDRSIRRKAIRKAMRRKRQ